MYKLKLIAFNMTETREGIPSAEDLRERLVGEIPEAEIPQLVDALRLFGFPLVRQNLERLLSTGQASSLLAFLPTGSLARAEVVLRKMLDTVIGQDIWMELLTGGPEEETIAAIRALDRLDQFEEDNSYAPSADILSRLLGEERSDRVKWAAGMTKAKLLLREHISKLEELLASAFLSVKVGAVEEIGEIAGREHLRVLYDILRNSEADSLLKHVAGEAIIKIKFREGGLSGLRNTRSGVSEAKETRAARLRFIGREQIEEQAWEPFSNLENNDPDVRRAAIWAVGEIWSEDALSSLVPRLEDPDAEARLAALEAILNILERAGQTVADADTINSVDLPTALRQAMQMFVEHDPLGQEELTDVLFDMANKLFARIGVQGDIPLLRAQLSLPSGSDTFFFSAAEALVAITFREKGIGDVKSLFAFEQQHWAQKVAVAKCIGEQGELGDIEALEGRLARIESADDEGNFDVKIALGEAIAQITFREKGLADVLEFLKDPNTGWFIVAGAARVLGKEGSGDEVRGWLVEQIASSGPHGNLAAEACAEALVAICAREGNWQDVLHLSYRGVDEGARVIQRALVMHLANSEDENAY